MSKAERDSWELAIAWALYVIGERTEKGLSPTFDSSLAEAEALRRYPDKPLANVREIVEQHLKDERYDGLFNSNESESLTGQCWCVFGETCPFSAKFMERCRPGVLVDGKIVEREKRDA